MSLNHLIDAPNTRSFINDGSDTIPAFAIMAVLGSTISEGRFFYRCGKPSTTFRRQYVVNGPVPVSQGGKGVCFHSGEVQVLYDTGSPTLGSGYGPKPDQWSLSANYPEVVLVTGVVDASSLRLLGQLHGIDTVIGKIATSNTLTTGSTCSVTVLSGAGGSETAITGMNITVRDYFMASGDTLPATTKVKVEYINGVAYVTQAACA